MGSKSYISNFFIFLEPGKIGFFREKTSIFLLFFYFRFFLPKIVSNPTENRFFVEKSAEKNDFLVLGVKEPLANIFIYLNIKTRHLKSKGKDFIFFYYVTL